MASEYSACASQALRTADEDEDEDEDEPFGWFPWDTLDGTGNARGRTRGNWDYAVLDSDGQRISEPQEEMPFDLSEHLCVQ